MGNTATMPNVPGGGNAHTVLPVDQVQYTGPQMEYRVLLINNQLKVGFLGGSISDVNNYMETLAQVYTEYFQLNTFFKVPYSMTQSGFRTLNMSYQGIFSRPTVYTPSHEGWRLQVVSTSFKLSVNYGALFSLNAVDNNMAKIYEILSKQSAAGGKLICMECSGAGATTGFSSVEFECNVMFNMPTHPNPRIYNYVAYSCPMNVQISFGGSVAAQMDYIGTLAMHLDQGYRLVDVIIPQHEATLNDKNRRRLTQLNVIWFFEKEAARTDTTPQYQVTIIDVYIPVSYGVGRMQAYFDLSNILSQMGQKGWNLVCVLDTPERSVSGRQLTDIAKVFFQRPIAPAYQPPPPQPAQQPPPPGFK